MPIKPSPWIRLLRLPAVLTVPGDVLVGAAFASAAVSGRRMASVLLAYLFGMVLNDLVDAKRDAVNRPERPIPSGEISKTAAWVLCFTLAATSFLLSSGFPVLCLLALVLLYTRLKQCHLWAGALLMAACRCAGLWIGAGAPVLQDPLTPVLLMWAILIVGVTLLADRENRESPGVITDAGVLTLFWCLAPVVALLTGTPRFPVFLPWALLTVLALQNLRDIRKQGRMLPHHTGQWLSMLIPLQSAFLFANAPLWQGIAVLSLFPLLRWSVRFLRIS